MSDETAGPAIVTGKAISRRTVLRGFGAALALPYLDAMNPAFPVLRAPAAGPIHRFQAFYVPNGMAMPYWTPATVELFAKYLEKLRATPDGDGTLLDHMTILYGAGISNSTRHSGVDLPVLLVGGGAGRLKGGRHLEYNDEPTMANLLVTLMDKFDMPIDRIGGSTGRLPIDVVSGI